jgi:hypothetical protein
LLFTWGIDVRQEERNVMATDQCHEACVVEMIHGRFLLPAICCFVRSFTFIKRLVGECSITYLRSRLLLCIDVFANIVNTTLWYHVFRVKKMETIACHFPVTMVEVAINRDVYIGPSVVE